MSENPTSAAVAAGSEPRRGRRARSTPTGARLSRASGVGLGTAVLWLSIVVLLPLATVVASSTDDGASGFFDTMTNDAVAAALRLTVGTALAVTVVNVIMGTLIAWVLVRDHFAGRAVLEVLIDVPFALPTIVAGLVLLSLYGPTSPIGINIAQTRIAIAVAVAFVTLPFVVRTVQPVLLELERDVEEAAMSLGASRFTTFRRIVLPGLVPAIASGAALSFARGISEYGAVVLIAGNLPFKTEIASVRILSQVENDQTTAAAVTATVLLVISLLTIVLLDVVQRWSSRRG
jgi:sulfate/thiosulfate transport system permease protein